MKILSLFLLSILFTCSALAEDLSKGQTIYVPVYSHIYTGDREKPFLLTATVSIRNTDLKNSITVTMADYYNQEGRKINGYVNKELVLKPLAAVRYVIKESDKQGGSGASVIVRWKSGTPVSEPIVESVMIGAQNQQGISFTSRGKVITETK